MQSTVLVYNSSNSVSPHTLVMQLMQDLQQLVFRSLVFCHFWQFQAGALPSKFPIETGVPKKEIFLVWTEKKKKKTGLFEKKMDSKTPIVMRILITMS